MILIIVGIAFICYGAYFLVPDLYKRMNCNSETEGIIVSTYMKEVYEFKQFTKYYYPVYEYEVNEKKYTLQPDEYSRHDDYFKLGAKTEVIYNKNNPAVAEVKSNFNGIRTGSIYAAIGFVFIIWNLLNIFL